MEDYTKHTDWELRQKQGMPLSAKILMTKKRIKAWHEHFEGQVYVSFSGGKDSTVLKHIVESMYPDVPSVFVNTGLEYPEVKRFACSQKNVIVLTPKMKFKDVLSKYGYPVISKEQAQYIHSYRTTKSERLKNILFYGVYPDGNKAFYKISEKWKFMIDAPFNISDKCCMVMKKSPIHEFEKKTGRKGINATMAEESILRRKSWYKTGCNAFDLKHPISKPMSFWTEQDVLQYIIDNNLEIPSVYGEIKSDENGKLYTTGADRTGCMFCAFGVQHESEPNRFQRMQITHPRLHEFCMKDLGMAEVLSFMKIPFENK